MGYLFGMTRTVHPFSLACPAPQRISSAGVSFSFPGQKGHIFLCRRCVGRSTRIGEMITQRLVDMSGTYLDTNQFKNEKLKNYILSIKNKNNKIKPDLIKINYNVF